MRYLRLAWTIALLVIVYLFISPRWGAPVRIARNWMIAWGLTYVLELFVPISGWQWQAIALPAALAVLVTVLLPWHVR